MSWLVANYDNDNSARTHTDTNWITGEQIIIATTTLFCQGGKSKYTYFLAGQWPGNLGLQSLACIIHRPLFERVSHYSSATCRQLCPLILSSD